MLYTITIEMQAWTDEFVTKFWDTTPLEKVAFLVSQEVIAQLALELTMEESTHKYAFRYFEHEDEAVAWLFKSQK